MPQREAINYVVSEIVLAGENAFSSGRAHADSLLVKRAPFVHEREVRLIYVGEKGAPEPDQLLWIAVEPNELISQVTFDPRLSLEERREREAEVRSLGYSRKVTDSHLYQKYRFQIRVKG